MRHAIVLVVLLSAAPLAQTQSANPLTTGARLHYGIVKGHVTRAAAKMPEEIYAAERNRASSVGAAFGVYKPQ